MEIEKKLLNYEKNLWLGFKTINLNFKEERNIGKILLYIFTQKKNLECEYANGIKQYMKCSILIIIIIIKISLH